MDNSDIFEEEHRFLINEVHKEQPTPANRLKREVLLLMQAVLYKNMDFYYALKNLYLQYDNMIYPETHKEISKTLEDLLVDD